MRLLWRGNSNSRSADFQSAVSQNCILRAVPTRLSLACIERPADCKSALQEIANLRYRQGGFTMVEIAICLAVIGFALVAILGVLPLGIQVQTDNRQDTIIAHDGAY